MAWNLKSTMKWAWDSKLSAYTIRNWKFWIAAGILPTATGIGGAWVTNPSDEGLFDNGMRAARNSYAMSHNWSNYTNRKLHSWWKGYGKDSWAAWGIEKTFHTAGRIGALEAFSIREIYEIGRGTYEVGATVCGLGVSAVSYMWNGFFGGHKFVPLHDWKYSNNESGFRTAAALSTAPQLTTQMPKTPGAYQQTIQSARFTIA